MPDTLTIHCCGDTGLLIELPDNGHVHAFASAVRAARLHGVVDLVPALDTLLVVVDPARTTLDATEGDLRAVVVGHSGDQATRTIEIPVRYDGDDLGWVAEHCGLDEHEVVRAHTSTAWRVGFCGFAPGFAYLIGGDPRLHVPRRDESRIAVPPGSVALAGQFSSIYPRRSPGGWQLIGHTEVALWDTEAESPALLLPGDRVVFREVG